MQIARHLCWWFVQNLNLRGRLSWGRCSMTLAHAGWAHSDLLLFNFGKVRFICKSGPPLLSSPLIGRGQRDLVCEVVIYSNLMHCPQIGEWACLPRPACLALPASALPVRCTSFIYILTAWRPFLGLLELGSLDGMEQRGGLCCESETTTTMTTTMMMR